MSLARAGRPEAALEVERIISAHAEHLRLTGRTAFWEALREQNLGMARMSLPGYAPSHQLDDLAGTRDRALGVAEELAPPADTIAS